MPYAGILLISKDYNVDLKTFVGHEPWSGSQEYILLVSLYTYSGVKSIAIRAGPLGSLG